MSEKPSVSDLMLDEGRGKPRFIEGVCSDQLVDVVLRLAMEVSTLRDRLDVHEAIAEEQGFGGREIVDNFEPDEAMTQRQASRREQWVKRVVHDLTS
ncbi:MAG: hypothetical protein AB8B96_00340 [Lysobacterales bacterium]